MRAGRLTRPNLTSESATYCEQDVASSAGTIMLDLGIRQLSRLDQ
jgi:hypothetical protein